MAQGSIYRPLSQVKAQNITEFEESKYDPSQATQFSEIRKYLKHLEKRQKVNHFRFLCGFLSILSLVVALAYILTTLQSVTSRWRRPKKSHHENLLLSPLINAGNLTGARNLAQVSLFPGIVSYSGFLTVDEECKSHLFFWFFPAASGNKSAPLLLWHGGGPGTSALFALFQGTGPIKLDHKGKSWELSNISWTQSRSVLYLDSPVGTGFSFKEKDNELCYASSSDDVADSAINALRQFYVLFPEYQPHDLYICSSSYGGKFAPTIAWRIDNDNQIDHANGQPSSINLKGVISISGFTDPINQIDYGEFYYNLGFIDEAQLKYFLSRESLAKSYLKNKKAFEAYAIIDPLIVGTLAGGPSYLKNITGIRYPYNFVHDLTDDNSNRLMHRHEKFLNQKWVQDEIHVNVASIGRNFTTSSNIVYGFLTADLYKSSAKLVENLLHSGCKFLFTSGQLDLVVPHTTVSKFLQELRWNGGHEFNRMKNSLWKYDGKVVGYAKNWDKLSYVMFRNCGHHPFVDEPELTLDLVVKFTQ